ncbi:unnamed protein product, partial [Adineta ricciae]
MQEIPSIRVELVRRPKRKPSRWIAKVASSNGNRENQKHLPLKSNEKSLSTEEHRSNYPILSNNSLNSDLETVTTDSQISSEKKTNRMYTPTIFSLNIASATSEISSNYAPAWDSHKKSKKKNKKCPKPWIIILGVLIIFMILVGIAIGIYALLRKNQSKTTISNPEWFSTNNMIDIRYYHTATVLTNGKVLIAGGNNGSVLDNAELFDPSTETWIITGSMNFKRFGHTATLLANGQVLIVGGFDSSTQWNSTELYNPLTGSWIVTSNMIESRSYHTATVLQNGKVLVTGGRDDNGVFISRCEIYNPSTGLWTSTGNMNNGRGLHTASILANGKVLVAGGYDIGVLNTAELYDPSTGIWTITGNTNYNRYMHTASILNNGKVLITAGSSNGALLNTAELYDPSTGLWSNTGSMNYTAYYHTSSVLQNGNVL